MRSITSNPFRILGLPVNSTEKQIAKRISDIQIYSEMGKTIKYDTDFLFIPDFERTAEKIRKAVSDIERPQRKLFYALLWFYEKTKIDELCFELLVDGNKDKAKALWQESIEKQSSNPNMFYGHNNLLTLYLVDAYYHAKDKGEFLNTLLNAIESLAFVLNNEQLMGEYIKQVCGDKAAVKLEITYISLAEEIYENYTEFIGVKKGVNAKEFLSSLSNLPKPIKDSIKGKFVNKPLQSIEEAIKEAAYNKKENPSHSDECGEELYERTKKDLAILQNILSSDDITYKSVADKLANEIEQCSLTFYNSLKDGDEQDESPDPADSALKLLKYAEKIAVGIRVKEKIHQGIEVLEENKKSGVYAKNIFAQLGKANEVRKANIVSEYPNVAKQLIEGTKNDLSELRDIFGRGNAAYLQFCDILVITVQGLCVEYANIRKDYSRVTTIMKQLDTMDASPEVKKKVKANLLILILNEARAPKSSCYIATMVYGDPLAPEVIMLKEFRDETLMVNWWGRIFVKAYYGISPHFVRVFKDNKAVTVFFRKSLDRLIARIGGRE